ncbi:MAG: metallophosphoesterase family protein [Thermodesulfobacteriota bacterium]
MRLLFLTDIHGSFKAVEMILQRIKADLYVLSGDLLYVIFPRRSTAWRFLELQQTLSGQREGPHETLRDTARRLISMDHPMAPLSHEYLHLCQEAQENMMRAYRKLEAVLQRHGQQRILVLPGNYDMDLAGTALSPWNFHMRHMELCGLRLAGYGGAKVITGGVPDHLQVGFKETISEGGLNSEPLEFFRKVSPDILILHTPPHGVMDALNGYGNVGSLGIRSYLDEAAPMAVLFGHMHRQWGAVMAGSTWCLNPSNFGRLQEVSGSRKGGYFLDIGLGPGEVQWAMIRRLVGERIIDVVHYSRRGGSLKRVILDENTFRMMGGDLEAHKPRGPLGSLQRIRAFFLRYESPQTKELVGQLRRIYRSLEREGVQVGFDLLGSLGFGMAQVGSDIDLVIYFRGFDCKPNDEEVCEIPPPVLLVLEELRKRGVTVEVCDSLDLERVFRAIREQRPDDPQLQRFVFYRAACRPVNLRLIKEVENELMARRALRRKVEASLRDPLEILVSSGRHLNSFLKYSERLKERGITLPQAIQKALSQYLRR